MKTIRAAIWALAVGVLAVVLGVTIALAPLGPGATRPGLRDLLWGPLLALVAVLALCAGAGWFGIRGGLFLARRKRAP